ncbi:MFS transporter [Nocardia farcinica]|uniref:MFS transporter n=1 Tax=Nocardia TaxID=1817 RepID=UPI000BF01FF9|nr:MULTISPECIES: MFS transporter [Nocardia]MBF6248962.1 MFS transporter [Nocardia farcinica]MBF6260286.1 MFS transporter [Nocardia farcinica]MBF6266286.1 MFS transporter [Nocardia farcinica]MBF6280044.1 MFS transporter [Nocardia farcinica]MBF6303296.1 MFS transporter [Nocardia farcinica]
MAQTNRPAAVLATVVIVQFMVSLDLSVVNVALPAIQSEFDMSATALQWVVNAYAVVFGGFLLLGGRLGDVIGRRRTMIAGLVLFGAASLAGGLATDEALLIGARAVQGLGAAALSPLSLALITVTFPEGPARTKAVGLWAAATMLGGALGVVAGGLLTDFVDWRWVLLINVPIVVAALSTAARGIGGAEDRARPRLDIAGALLVTTAMLLLILGVVRTDEHGWASAVTVGTLAVGVVLLAAFVVVETRVAEPLMRLGLLAHGSVAGANVFGFMITAGQLAAFYFVSLHMQSVLLYSPATAGVCFVPFALGAVGGMRLVPVLVNRFGHRATLVVGGLLGAVGIAWFGTGGPGGTFLTDILGPSVVASVGIGISFVVMGTIAMRGVAAEEAGMASGLLNSSRQLGGALGLAVLATVAATVTVGDRTPAALSDGYSAAFFMGGALIAVGTVIAGLLIPRAEVPAKV